MSDQPSDSDQSHTAPDEAPGRAIARIGRMIEETVDEAIGEHERKCFAQSDEPPVRAIGSVTRYVNMAAEQAAADAIREHMRLHHSADVVLTTDELLDRLRAAQ